MNKREEEKLLQGWVKTTLGKILPLTYGKGLTEKERDSSGKVPVYGSSGQIGWHSEALTQKPTLIIGRKGTVGSVYYSLVPCWAIDTTYYFECDSENINLLYFYYLLSSINLRHSDSSSIVPGLNRNRYNAIEIPVPPFLEQKRIVDEIEKQFSRLDEAVKSIERMQKNLRKLRVSTLKWACEGKLVPTESELSYQENRSFESATELLERNLRERYSKWETDQIIKMQQSPKLPKDSKWKTKYNEPEKPNTNDLPELSAGWVWATVEQLASFEPNSITDGPFGSNLKSEHYTDTGPRVIRLQNIGDGVFNDVHAHISQEHFEKLKKHQIFEGNIVIAALGEVLPRACLIPEFVGEAVVKADCIRFAPNPDLVTNEYINFALNSDPVRSRTTSIVHGVGRPRLNLTEIKAIVVPLPPLTEQKRIVAEVKRRLIVIDELEKVVSTNLQRTENLRRKILQDAFAGRIVEQNPTDEPASVLLERIKVEREGRQDSDSKKRRGKKQQVMRKKIERRDIIEVLKESKTKMTPEQLFHESGFNPDEVEEFYAELKKADSARAIEQEKKNGGVYLMAKV